MCLRNYGVFLENRRALPKQIASCRGWKFVYLLSRGWWCGKRIAALGPKDWGSIPRPLTGVGPIFYFNFFIFAQM